MQFTLLSALVATSAALGGLASPLGNSTKGHASLNKRFTSSRWTFYDVGLGACGETNVNSDYIVALNADQFGSGYPGPYCGKSITLTYGGKTATAKVMDRCPGCPYGGLDLSRGLFNYFASEDVGVLTGEWDFVGSSSEGTTTSKAAATTTTPTSQKPTSTKAATTTSSTPKTTTSASQQRYTRLAAVNTKATTSTHAASRQVLTPSSLGGGAQANTAHTSPSVTRSASIKSDTHASSQTASPSATGNIASAVAGAASLPTGSATAEQMKEDLQLVGQILNQLGDFFDKYLAAQNKDSN